MTLPKKITFLFVLFQVMVSAQNLLPPVYNYSLLDYKGAGENWDLTTNEQGELFVANNKGMLHFDGEEWNLYKLPNNTIIRSILSHGDRIYTGSYEEFGYWKKNGDGLFEYHSLTHLIQDHTFTSEEFWEILPIKGMIVFRSFSSIYIYEKNQIRVIDPPQVISDFIEYEGKLLVAAGRAGLYELVNEVLKPLDHQKPLKGKTLTDMVVVDRKLLIGSKLDGCFVFDGNNIEPWQNTLNAELKSHQLNKIVSLTNGKLAFGTIKNGVYLNDSQTGTSQIVNRKTGLQNNTVLSMLQYEDQLWLGLDNGVARLRLDNSITYYTDYSGALGMVYDMALYEGKVYLGSNTGVFYFESDRLKFVNGSQGHVWDLEIIDNDLVCGHNTGTFKVKENTFKRMSNFAGGYEIIRIPEQKDRYMQGIYTGLLTYHKGFDGQWEVTEVTGIGFPVKQLCFESPHVLWVAHPYKGFYRIHLNEDYSSVSKIDEFNGDSVPNNYNVKIYKIKNQIVFCSQGSWYKYDTILEEIVPFVEFGRFKDQELLSFEGDYFWFVDGEGNKDLVRTDLKTDSLVIGDLALRRRLVPEAQRMVRINDSISYITLSDGFAKVNVAQLKQRLNNYQLPVPELTFIKDKERSYVPDLEPLPFSFKKSRILTVGFATPKSIQPRYHYALSGPENHSGYVEEGVVSFQNLAYGDYVFEVSTVGIDNRASEANSFEFKIAPPWFLSNLSVTLYLVLVLICVILVRRYNQAKLKRKQKELEEQMQKEQDRRIAQLEREELAKKVKLKQNELASTALNIARKNEMILELKNMLVLNKDNFPNSQRFRSFIRKLNNSVKDTEDWKRFEVSFKELHEDFFERLLMEYPELTPKDLKLCAYLKMNLSTKEIAPLMGITIRGVEIHRYRLRKKLELESTKNLSNFLITFS
ncbi:Two component regulator three Y domain-containing protein [Muricauda sp. SCSIO 64092]|uniref:helix-turn-helix and ligand-binding sensor domain-containing protein n=1 Tax=Allomuricauda sp. SCSIO 64092 TaxID=2908842 RepID=UPI001FF1DDAF|nr:Two component regulator three Y domain-containing protein [Muricauda sp. SCSIO 64092]UOY05849.1 Two component regulator three Y domain-containing protein [Muricauda sp. SCSIO 64092]